MRLLHPLIHRVSLPVWWVALWLLYPFSSVSAQEFERMDGLYTPIIGSEYLSNSFEPDLSERPVSDTTLFRPATGGSSDLFERILRFDPPSVAWDRRGILRDGRRMQVEGMDYSSAARSVMRLLGATESTTTADGVASTVSRSGFRWDPADTLDTRFASLTATTRKSRVIGRMVWTGRIGNGWQGSAALEARLGRDADVRGVFSEGVRLATRWRKKFVRGSEWQIAAWVPITTQGTRRPATKEAFEQTGDRYYNPSWGFQRGKVRNASVLRERLPAVWTSWASNSAAPLQWRLTGGMEVGTRKQSGLGWYDARTPMPDYYRYMPGYAGDRATEEAWRQRDPRYTQIDWDELIRCNRLSGGDARYYVEDRVDHLLHLHARAEVGGTLHRNWSWRGGIEAESRSSRRFKEMSDLLGAARFTDLDCFLMDDMSLVNRAQNNLHHPNRRIQTGDRFGYDYTLREAAVRAFAQIRLHTDRSDLHARLEWGKSSVRRIGHYEKEIFPGNNSYGASRRVSFAPFHLSLQTDHRVATRSQLSLSASWTTDTPDAEALFYQPQYNNRIVEHPKAESLGEIVGTYRMTGRNFEWQTSIFGVYHGDRSLTTRYYDDTEGLYCDLYIEHLNTRIFGCESAVEYRPATSWLLTAAVSWMNSRYAGDPRATIRSDAENQLIENEAVCHMGGCRPGRMPEVMACGGVRYESPTGWGFRLSAEYAGGRHIEAAPLRRTDRVIGRNGSTPESFERFLRQERLSDLCTVNLVLFKHFRCGSVPMTAMISVEDLADRAGYYYGYESLRVERRKAGDEVYGMPQAARYTPLAGRSWSIRLSARF